MTESDALAERFEEHRTRLRAIARRILGSPSDADDAVQEAWLRFRRSDTSAIHHLESWLTTVVSRVCLNMLQSRTSQPQPLPDSDLPEGLADSAESDPEHEALLADSIGLALLIVLDTLAPAERVAFVLHDVFAIPFEQIAPIVERTTPATRQLASRARRRILGQDASRNAGRLRQAQLVDAFLAATRNGDFGALLAVLDPEIVLRADDQAARLGAIDEMHGAAEIAAAFSRRARGARPALVDDEAGAVWIQAGQLRVVVTFTTSRDKITGINLIANPARLSEIDLVIPEDGSRCVR
jgi:RNA polymerase sigma factor (sigma-70 family)